MERIARRQIFNCSRLRIDTQTVARADLLHIIADLEKRQTDIDAVAVEDARKACRNHDGNTRCRNGNWGMLTRGTAAEILSADHDVAPLHTARERRVDVLHAVRCERLRLERIEIACGDDDIRVNVIAVAPNLSLEHHATSSGAAIRPSIALAAATCGPAR